MKKGMVVVLLCVLCGLHVFRFELAAEEDGADAARKTASVDLAGISEESNAGTASKSHTAESQAVGGEAVVDVNFIFKNLPEFKRNMDEIKQSVQSVELELRKRKKQTEPLTERIKLLQPDSEDFAVDSAALKELHREIQTMVKKKREEILQREAEVYQETFQQITAEITAYAKLRGIRIVHRADTPSKTIKKVDVSNRLDVAELRARIMHRAETSSKAIEKVDVSNRRAVLTSINRPVLFVDRGQLDMTEDITQPILQRLLARSKPETPPASDAD